MTEPEAEDGVGVLPPPVEGIENNKYLSEKGYYLLVDLEVGRYNSKLVRLDENGNITHIKTHDVGDGGTTVGVGIYVKSTDTERIKMLSDLGIIWNDTSQWVEIEKINIAFNQISSSYNNYVLGFQESSNIKLTQQQFDALFIAAYNKPALLKNNTLIELASSMNTNEQAWNDAFLLEYKQLNTWDKFGKGWTNRIKDTVELYLYGDYKKDY